jgi:nucleotide-binding universal stress UspA family protein
VYAADVPVGLSWSRDAVAQPDLQALASEVAGRGAALAALAQPGLAVRGAGAVGSPAAELIARSAEAGLVVVGRRPRGALQAAVLGSVSFSVTLHARCPVVVVQSGSERLPGPGAPVVVGVDGSRSASVALTVAAQLARAWEAPLRVVCAWTTPVREPWSEMYAGPADLDALRHSEEVGAAAEVELAQQRARELDSDLVVGGAAVEGAASDVLLAESERAGLVVVGSRGHGGFAGMMLGSVGHSVLRGAHSPVTVVRRGGL